MLPRTRCDDCKNQSFFRQTQIKSHCLSRAQSIAFIEFCSRKFRRAICEPGTAVGAIAATSIGELFNYYIGETIVICKIFYI